MRNLACALLLTERDDDHYLGMVQADGKTPVNPPQYKGRIVTTIHKAKEVRPMVEKCVTIAKKAIPHMEAATEFATDADRNTEAWKKWRESDQWNKWNQTMAPAIAARRRVFSMLRDKDAVEILFDEVAPRFSDRPGGYTRILRLAKPRLGDAGTRAILEFVGVHDRVKTTSEKPQFESDDEPETKEVENEATSEEDVAESEPAKDEEE
jgi:large subunit ribosomal protein L17